MATRVILASKILKISQGSMPPNLRRTVGVPFKTHFAKPHVFPDPGPSINPLLVLISDHKDEQHNSSDWPSTIIYAL